MTRRLVSVLLTLVLLVSCFSFMVVASAAKAEDGLKINGSKVVAVGKKITLSASMPIAKWKSSDKKIATVSEDGVVKGKKPGKVKITAKAEDGSKKTWKITVYEDKVKSVKISASTKTLDLNGTKSVKLKAEASPDDAAQEFTWKSSDPSVAKVNSSGKVTAVSVGKAKITATAQDGSKKSKSITIKVKNSKKEEEPEKPVEPTDPENPEDPTEPEKPEEPPVQDNGELVGISMPTRNMQRWKEEGEILEYQLKEAGYDVELQYASYDVPTQLAQIETMIDNGAKVVVVAAIEVSSLGRALDKASENGCKVIAYDRLLMDNKNVDYYVSFDNYEVGILQGNYVRNKLNLDNEEGPFNIEFSAGDPGDNNAKKYFNGAMSVLRKYISNGKLVVKSGQTDFSSVATPGWKSSIAQKSAGDILSAYYADGSKLDAWVCSNDSIALGVTNALASTYSGKWPIITGQDCDIPNVKNIITGKQAMSVFKDTRILASSTAKMVGQILRGETVIVNDTNTYNNNRKIVPTYLCDPVFCDAHNYKELLIYSGVYTENDLK